MRRARIIVSKQDAQCVLLMKHFWVQERAGGERARVSGGKRTLSSSVCTSNDGQSRAAHWPEAGASTPPRASALCACSSSSRRRSSATFALAPAASLCAISSQSTGMAIVYYCWIARDDVNRADSMPCLRSQKTSHPPMASLFPGRCDTQTPADPTT
jgi:hypothetical protein